MPTGSYGEEIGGRDETSITGVDNDGSYKPGNESCGSREKERLKINNKKNQIIYFFLFFRLKTFLISSYYIVSTGGSRF